MNKKEFIDFLAKENDISKIQAQNALDIVIDGMQKALVENDNISLIGFGTFNKKKVAGRNGHNPKTGEIIKIAARNQISFKVSKPFKDMCNK